MDVEKIVAAMTLEEKTSLLSGADAWHTKAVERLGIPRYMVADGPHGLRKQVGKSDNLGINKSIEAVCFPSAAGVAASFDRDLAFRMGDALGKECRAENVAILLGPAINLKRSPLCGRNFEYLSEDPYLAGELAAAYIKGVQQNGVGVSVKHYAANNQETRRLCVSAEIDRRTLFELYLPAFEKAVKNSAPWTLMCSYNRINGEYSSENKWLLTDVLRDRWGFKGFVMSDWGAVYDRVKGVDAGLELEMPASGGINDRKVAKAVRDGVLDESVVDTAVKRLLSVLSQYEDFAGTAPISDREALALRAQPSGDRIVDSPSGDQSVGAKTDCGNSADSLSADRNSNVKTDCDFTVNSPCGDHDFTVNSPSDSLDFTVKTTFCDDFSVASPSFDRKKDHEIAAEIALSTMVLLKNNGILPLKPQQKVVLIGEFAKKPRYQGGGSSHINPHRVVSARDALSKNPNVTFAKGYDTALDKADDALESEALRATQAAEVAVVFLGLPDRYESEGYDRKTIDLPDYQNRLLNRIAEVQQNVVVVLHNGSPVAMPWIDRVSAVLESYLAGEAVGEAQAKLLYGERNPSGKLAETFPLALSDTASSAYFPGDAKTVEYREGLYVGYRFFQTAKRPVLFPFGHGLSYTSFAYSDLKIEGEFPFTVRFKIENTGNLPGAEIAQIYVHATKSSVYRPESELKGFEKVFLEPGDAQEITVELADEAFRTFNAETDQWYREEGMYEIRVGASSENILLTASVGVPGAGIAPTKKEFPHYERAEVDSVPDREFETLLMRKLSLKKRDFNAELTAADTMDDAKDTKWGRRILKLARVFIRGDETVNAEMIYRGFAEMPLENYKNMTGRKLNDRAIEGILGLLNNKGFFKSMWNVLRGLTSRE